MEDSNRISYFLLGLGVGAAVGMMFAPKAGADARDFLQSKSRETADQLVRRGQEIYDRAADTIERRKQGVSDQLNNLSTAVDAGTKAFKQATKDASRAMVDATHS